MTGKERITKALEQVWDASRVAASDIARGYRYSGAIEASGWWVTPFNENSIYLGANIAEAVETVGRWRRNRQRSRE